MNSARAMTPDQEKAAARAADVRRNVRNWYARNREQAAAKAKAWRAANPEKHRRAKTAWVEKNPEKAKLSRRKTRLKAYGITVEQYEAMFAAQGRVCAICTSPDPKNKNGWSLDHCHTTGVVRGILCHPCNIILGSASDEVAVLEAAISYLRRSIAK